MPPTARAFCIAMVALAGAVAMGIPVASAGVDSPCTVHYEITWWSLLGAPVPQPWLSPSCPIITP